MSLPSYHTIALIVAGGKGSRTRKAIPKQYLTLGTMPMLRHTVLAFLQHPNIDAVCVVYHPDDLTYYEQAVESLDLLPPALAGTTRQASVYSGLQSIQSYAPRHVLIHDAARPYVDATIIDQVLASIAPGQGAIPVIPLEDTLKQYHPGTLTVHTLDRSQMVRAQTPQAFLYSEILDAHRQAAAQAHPMTDDAAVYEAAGHRVITVTGCTKNIKITTQQDLRMAEYLHGIPPITETRTGLGFDVHAFCEPKSTPNQLMLCGVAIPHPYSLKGHSDADVGLHALTDALLATISDGDIGEHFSDKDPAYRNMDSTIFLTTARDRVIKAGGHIIHVDITLIGESPKVSPHRLAMRQRIATILGISEDRVSIKATTTEGLGFTGRREGLAAQAVASVQFLQVNKG